MPLDPREEKRVAELEERLRALEERNQRLERLLRSGRAFTNNPLSLSTDLDDLGSIKTFLEFDEVAAPGTPPAGVGRLYGAARSGDSALSFAGDDGVLTEVTHPPSVQVHRGGTLTFTTNVLTDFTYPSEAWDTDGLHESVTNPERLTANIDGIWLVYAQTDWAAHAAHTQRLIHIITQGGTVVAANAVFASTDARGVSQGCMTQKACTAGEWLKVQVRQRSGGNLASGGGVGQTFFGMVWLRPLP